jgi:hypothetical protein
VWGVVCCILVCLAMLLDLGRNSLCLCTVVFKSEKWALWAWSGRVCPSLPAADANNRLQPDYRSVSLLDSSFTSFNSIMGNGILFAVELPSLPLANLPLGSKGTLPKSPLDPPEGEVTTL